MRRRRGVTESVDSLMALISARVDEDIMRELANCISDWTNARLYATRETVYYVQFRDLVAMKRRLYRQINPRTQTLDRPLRVASRGRLEVAANDNIVGEQARLMTDRQILLVLGILPINANSFSHVVSHVFEL